MAALQGRLVDAEAVLAEHPDQTVRLAAALLAATADDMAERGASEPGPLGGDSTQPAIPLPRDDRLG